MPQPFQSNADYEALRSLLRAVHHIQGPPTYASTGSLDWARFGWSGSTEPITDSMHLWYAPNTTDLLGAAWASPSGSITLLSHPEHRDIEADMLDWAEHHIPSNASPSVRCLDEDPARIALLSTRGYTQSPHYTSYQWRSLGEPLAEPSIPKGYTLTTLEGHLSSDKIDERVQVHNVAYPHQTIDLPRYRAILDAPSYRPELDLIIRDPDDNIAAFALAWYDEETLHGLFEPVGCHPKHRRLGLTRALLYEALHQLKLFGAVTAHAPCAHDNLAAASLYASMSFQNLGRSFIWSR